MSKVERLYHLHNILNQRRTPISRQDLMERLECSQATLYRLVGELRDFLGAPIEQDPDSRGFYLTADEKKDFINMAFYDVKGKKLKYIENQKIHHQNNDTETYLEYIPDE